MADEIKIKGTGGVPKTDSLHNRNIRKVSYGESVIKTERTTISEEAKILREFVPKILASIEKERNIEPKPTASNAEIAKSLTEELVKSILAKKFIE